MSGASGSAAASLADRLSQYKAGVEDRIAKKRQEKEAQEVGGVHVHVGRGDRETES